MLKNEFKRILRSRSTIVIVFILVAVAVISFFISYNDKSAFVVQLTSDSPDLNKQALINLIDSYKGNTFIFDFWYTSDFSTLFIMILFMWMGISFSSVPMLQKDSGFGNFIITRYDYKKYIRDIIIAQSLCIISVVFIVMVLMFVIATVMGGGISSLTYGIYKLSAAGSIVIILLQFLELIMCAILINGISLLISVWIKNKYIIQIFPIVGFFLLPILIGSVIPNFIPSVTKIILLLIPLDTLKGIYMILQDKMDFGVILYSLIPFFIYGFLFVFIYIVNRNQFTENYL
ncbi:hypothetical protein [Anaerobium acetethylicum]|uniref:ABC-2 family transporter protein n=1 Tax=Anaerobium acetethylicum TaxID=1619234 RepID=A0A1D3TVX2_9FIRM|nr:hypothetical protein [Anaerobium acetethylicum]SCP98281.1 hypothetical protein SAMN05421730_101865 [Anaerobium acetethylicum]